MDGYVITANPDTAWEAYDHPDVRHVAELDDGHGFVAFNGYVPCDGSVLENEQAFALVGAGVRHHGPMVKVRKHGPVFGQPERFFLFANVGDFDRARAGSVKVEAASLLTGGRVLAMTAGGDLAHSLWSARALAWCDKRVELVPA